MPVFDRIEMNVVDVLCDIGFVAQGMLPITPLPNPAFAFSERLCEIRSPRSKVREKVDLIRRHRKAKSAFASGNVQIA